MSISWRQVREAMEGKKKSERYFVAGQDLADYPPDGCLCSWKSEEYGQPWQRVTGRSDCPIHHGPTEAEIEEFARAAQEAREILQSWNVTSD